MNIEPLYIDIEATYSGDIQELGLIYKEEELKTTSIKEAYEYIQDASTNYIVGHNIIAFDKKILETSSINSLLHGKVFIDTLPISMLLFNEKTFHNLPKNYKNEDNFLNDPVKDAKLSKELLVKSINKFRILPTLQRNILFTLLKNEELFEGFFELIEKENIFEELSEPILKGSILNIFKTIVKNQEVLQEALELKRIELAYILAIRMPELEVNAQPPKVLYDYPDITSLQERMCFDYDNSVDELSSTAEEIFGFGTFRDFPRQNATLETGNMISQKEIVQAGLKNESFLAILPTGGGKTFTFWLPSLIKAKSLKTLTVIVSPLQALIKDHMESFHESVANYKAVALSGYLSPTERSDAMDKVINGDADILYLAPESLRSNSVFNLLKNRVIERFVIDEAHCLSTWGNDFRHDYFYIGTFIKDLLKEKPFQEHIPISCFTATAKPQVIEDITEYIESSLNVQMSRYIAIPERKNLDYEGYELEDDKAKYTSLLEFINKNEGSTLIYIPSSTKKCDDVAEQLSIDTGKNVKSFHSKLETDIKMQILKDYIDDTIDIVVATTAFGMGVDKPNIKNVIHYEISESLENYSQEAGRGARDQKLRATCPLLFSQSDLDKHFTTLTRSKINADEINSIFKVLKSDKRNPVALTTREIAAKAGWDTEDNSNDYDMKVKTALLELEREDYLERSRNKVQFYADAIALDSLAILQEAYNTKEYSKDSKDRLSRILQTLLGRGKPEAVQLDEMTELLGYSHAEVTQSVLELKEMKIISDAKDLSLKISKDNRDTYTVYQQVENILYEYLVRDNNHTIRMSELNQLLLDNETLNIKNENMAPIIKVLLKSWIGNRHQFKFNRIDRQKDLWYFEFIDTKKVKEIIGYKHYITSKIMKFLTKNITDKKSSSKESVEFSMLELQEELKIENLKIIDKALLHLHELKVIELGNGRFIYYAPMNIQKLDRMLTPNKKYTKQEYKTRLEPYYQRKMESIHIVGEYSTRLIKDSKNAQIFMKNYFTLSRKEFLKKYGELEEKFKRPMTEYRYNKIFNELSDEQKKVIDDNESQGMMILAGPGSGKTKVLVHKIASLILQENIKADQFLMLTYSRTAMLEFKSRLFELIGQLAYDIDIFTFHGFSLQLVGREVSSDDDLLKNVVALAAKQINDGKIEVPFKTVLVLDEYQDINADGFELIKALSTAHENKKRLIAVGDDDQCILSNVNGADIKYIKLFEDEFGINDEDIKSYAQYELLTNFRSLQSIVEYSNNFINNINMRYKKHPLLANSKHQGEVVILNCNSQYLQQPAIEQVKDYIEKDKSLAVLAFSNNEVADIYSLLHEEGIPVSYLLNNDGFKLSNLVEIRYVDQLLKDKELNENLLWEVYEESKKRYTGSKNLLILYGVIKGFIDDHELYTPSLWSIYLDEISSEQLVNTFNKVLVSTIHKSKGKEFDTVVLMAHKATLDDEFIRLFYVGMTRAKKKLIIVTDNSVFSKYATESVENKHNTNVYIEPKRKTLVMDLEHLYLSFRVSKKIDLIAGSQVFVKELTKDQRYYLVQNDILIAQFSKKMQSEIEKYERQGYKVLNINIENVVEWFDKQSNINRQLPLCKLVMEK
ncbi:ATP-dependent DNA helicase [Sulfurimonas gotlandica GD1]|uniref:DNA 3'-5' helicase n=1 Tax=Sulfurimonas gotlandica (strain DSM 19862 / JCM 16533 / GD1) TaxID=929558 RepID=B6BL54_SULGG|nr:RecQ family ATP-dependent DNA helicase [Sulfurimonas gotlandica]EDZ62212.1 ATP-dependent DNA helicase, RecQ family, putative [Sulfurimonas gotlandica GD1]EHP28791.1 ATP-dependent DNA helicase [Sulfurimonas gotlandica GD1]